MLTTLNSKALSTGKMIVYISLATVAQLKLFHWQTLSYARHKALDELQESLQEKFDRLVESYSGRFGTRPQFPTQERTITIENLNAGTDADEIRNIEEFVDSTIRALRTLDRILDLPASEISEILNIRDEIVGDLDRFKYLLRFH